MRGRKYTLGGIILGAVMVYLIMYHVLFDNYTSLNKTSRVNLQYIVVHLDLKGSPPKLAYLTGLLPLFKKLGVNGVLMEYEDTFPYHGPLANLSSTEPFDRNLLKRFLLQANTLGIEIIPLIQTFGHMEHALKLQQFQHLREVNSYPDSICPSNEESIYLIKNMLQQVIQFHGSVKPLKHIHIGCDEVYHLNKCSRCHNRKLESRNLFVNHINKVKSLIEAFNPLISILMWDDMFREIHGHKWNKKIMTNLNKIEPVYWDYTPQLKRMSHISMYNYHKTFKNIWIASAFKGADGKRAYLPKLQHRFQNHYSWMKFILNYIFAGDKEVFNFKGIILTGWSRYSHFDPLCELLPASLSSLIMNLLVIERFKYGVTLSDTLLTPDVFFEKYIAPKLSEELKCNSVIRYEKVNLTIEDCKYRSNEVAASLKNYNSIISDITTTLKYDNNIIAMIEDYSIVPTVNVLPAEIGWNWAKSILKRIRRWEKEFSKLLLKYYDKYVIYEYVGYKTYSIKKIMNDSERKLKKYLKQKVWERRSYNFSFTSEFVL